MYTIYTMVEREIEERREREKERERERGGLSLLVHMPHNSFEVTI